MGLKRLNNDVQSLLSASTRIHSYKQVVEELVYNALDAEATSIAIRIHIEKNTVQVIDNGNGIKNLDFKLLGQKYATSRCVDVNTLQSVPHKYGFKGLALSSLIKVSRSVTITSRCENDDITMTKVFKKGKEKEISESTQRPSKGTTVEIKGFLHNLNIQKKSINAVSELQNIKKFVKQLSLVQSNISLSLRDDSTNDIIFKLHKNRDVYQILSSVFGIDRSDLQELQVEKNHYKVTAFIGKQDKDLEPYNWVYINGKFINNKEIYKIVNGFFAKKTIEKPDCVKGLIPLYFIFITCPYYDYYISETPKQSILDFKTWEPIKNLIEKLLKFYTGNIEMKEVKNKSKEGKKAGETEETRDKVKKIMDKILGNMKRPGVTQMQRGVKGKIIKRTDKTKNLKISLSKILPNNVAKLLKENKMDEKKCLKDLKGSSATKFANIPVTTTIDPNHEDNMKSNIGGIHWPNNKYITIGQNSEFKPNTRLKHKNKLKTNQTKTYRNINGKYMKKNLKHHIPKNSLKVKDPLIQKFESETVSVKKRCLAMAKAVDELISYKEHPTTDKLLVSKTYSFRKVRQSTYNNKEIGHKNEQKILELPLAMPSGQYDCDDRYKIQVESKSRYASNYDLVQTILKTQVNTIEYLTVASNKSANISKVLDKSEFEGDDFHIEHMTPSAIVIPNTLLADSVGSSYSYAHGKIDNEDTAYSPLRQDVENPNFIKDRTMDVDNIRTLDFDFDYCLLYDRKENNYNSFTNEDQPTDCSPIHPTKLTYDSHQCNFDEPRIHCKPNIRHDINVQAIEQNQKVRFITKHSWDNFDRRDENTFQRTFKNKFKQISIVTRKKSYLNRKPIFNFNKIYTKRHDAETSYNIEFTKSSRVNNACIDQTTTFFNLTDFHDTTAIHQTKETNSPAPSQGRLSPQITLQIPGTYTIPSRSNHTLPPLIPEQHEAMCDSVKTYIIQRTPPTLATEEIQSEIYDRNERSKSKSSDNDCFEPLKFCETELRNINSGDQSNHHERLSKSLFREEFSIESMLCERNNNIYSQKHTYLPVESNSEKYSHHFIDETTDKETEKTLPQEQESHMPFTNNEDVLIEEMLEQVNLNSDDHSLQTDRNLNKSVELMKKFNFKNRPRFVPKGLSPIFENCQTKNICDYEMESEYFDQGIYDNFAQDVQINSEIFEPNVQGMKELTTKDIHRVNTKLKKDNASLKFDSESLKSATVLGQIDNKFIAAKIRAKTTNLECLVLFDQHAVHERVCLENNMADYFKKDTWKSIPLDPISIKVSKDEIVYMHNYREKFALFGLEWNILNQSEISVNAIPEAILGKNTRSVAVVMKAVKRLITEETNAIKTQKGCVSLQPKSIMDLVFTEACKYAVKFGDRLTKTDCVEFLNLLSKCKVPFQCAHGRPVMAVLMDLKSSNSKYQIDMSKIRSFIRQ